MVRRNGREIEMRFREVVRYAEEANIGWAWWPWK